MALQKTEVRRRFRWLAPCAVLGASVSLAGACTLPGDFDDLQGGPAEAPGGSAGTSECTKNADCNDDDPCTEDTCDDSQEVAVCKNEPREGVFPDGLEQSLEMDKAMRATLAKSEDTDTYYVSVFSSDADVPNLELYTAKTTGSELTLEAGTADLVSSGAPASAMARVGERGGLFRLHAFVGVDDGGTGRVDLLHFNDKLRLLSTETLTTEYDLTVPYRAPIAWAGGGSYYGAFIETLGRIGFHTVNGATETLTSIGYATQLAPLTNEKGDPGVLFTTAGAADMGGQVFAQAVGKTQVEVKQCEPAASDADVFYQASSLVAGLKGVNLTTFTRLDTDDGYVTEVNRAVVCSSALPNGCVADAPTTKECTDSVALAARPVAQDAVDHPGNASGVILHAFASPQLVLDASAPGGLRVDLTLLAQVLDLSNIEGDDPTKPQIGVKQIGEPVVLSSLPLPKLPDGLAEGADLPELRVIGNKILITWLERSNDDTDHVQVQRLAICEQPAQ